MSKRYVHKICKCKKTYPGSQMVPGTPPRIQLQELTALLDLPAVRLLFYPFKLRPSFAPQILSTILQIYTVKMKFLNSSHLTFNNVVK